MSMNRMPFRSGFLDVRRIALAGLALAALAAPLAAQYPQLTTPQPSPAASVSQTVGITKITVDYARPAVKGRTIWGDLVPYGQVWRAGANMNTVVDVSTPFSVQGHQLPAGKYGLHTIPTAKDWTVIFSNDADQWGSFSYNEKRDALRVTVTPTAGPMEESLAYWFDDVTDNGTNLVLAWEKVRVAIPIAVDTKTETMAALKSDLNGLAQFFWQPWNAAANYSFNNKIDVAQGEAWASKSVEMNENFINSRTKAKFMRLRGDNAGADALVAKAMGGATEQELNAYGYELLGEGKTAEAITMFRKNAKDHPQSWNTYDSLGEALLKDPKTAAEGVAMYKKALAMAPAAQKARIEGIIAKAGKA